MRTAFLRRTNAADGRHEESGRSEGGKQQQRGVDRAKVEIVPRCTHQLVERAADDDRQIGQRRHASKPVHFGNAAGRGGQKRDTRSCCSAL